jgi:predicted NAD/FAD-binding protein
MNLSRRNLLQGSLAAIVTYGLYQFTRLLPFANTPIPGELLGASANIGHQLRNGHFPKPSKTINKQCVIIGGGIAGLAAGYRLDKAGVHDFILLDLEKHTGGNAHSGKNTVCAYPWGAHYVPLLTEESRCVRRLFEDLGIISGYDSAKLPIYKEEYICQDPNERLFRLGRWQDGLIPTLGINKDDEAQYRRFFGLMTDLKTRKGKDGLKLFAIPVDTSSQDPDSLALDKLSMAHWLAQHNYTSEPLRWYINYCCRDDFGTTLETTSAWAGIHYFAARSGRAANTETDSVITWPEGNGWLATALTKPIKAQVITQALAYAINDTDDDLTVDYLNTADHTSIRIQTKSVIIATPRFIAARLLQSTRFKISSQDFTYSPWAVANITLSLLPAGKGVALSWDNVVFNSELLGYVNASHQITQMTPIATVLTYYWPLTHTSPEAARQQALQRPYAEWQNLFLQELLRIHPELIGYVERVDIWLWGHGMIRPTPGFIWGDKRRQALEQQPPIFTAHSDMSGISIFEEAYTRGISVAEQVLAYHKLAFESEL